MQSPVTKFLSWLTAMVSTTWTYGSYLGKKTKETLYRCLIIQSLKEPEQSWNTIINKILQQIPYSDSTLVHLQHCLFIPTASDSNLASESLVCSNFLTGLRASMILH